MEIITKYQTRTNSNVGKIVAKSGGKQKSTTVDQSKSNDWNHGTAAGAWLLKHGRADSVERAMDATHEVVSDDGQTHKFVI